MASNEEHIPSDFTQAEFEDAWEMATYRCIQSIRRGDKNVAGLKCNAQKNVMINLVGCLGEIAAAKALGVEGFQLSEGTYKRPDIVDKWGAKWHCRATRHADGRLKVTKRDPRSGRYILVIISPDYRSARVVGYCNGQMVDKIGWRGDPTNSGRDEALWVWQDRLKPVAAYLGKREVASC